MDDQKQLWDKIAKEWDEYKKKPSRFTLDFLNNQSGKILDLGSGSGRHLTKINNGKMYLIDFSDKMIELAREKSKKENIPSEFFVSVIEKLPFEDNFFDAAICINSIPCLEGISKIKKAIKELYRVLKPNAKAKIDLWNKDSKRFKNSPKEIFINWKGKGKRYYYLFTPSEAYELFEKAGFKIIKKTDPERSLVFIVEKPN